jgi:hypothetical protein
VAFTVANIGTVDKSLTCSSERPVAGVRALNVQGWLGF